MVAIAGAQALILQLSAKYHSPNKSKKGTTIAAATDSCECMKGGIFDLPRTTAATPMAYTRRRITHKVGAFFGEHMSFRAVRTFCVTASAAVDVPVFVLSLSLAEEGFVCDVEAVVAGALGFGAGAELAPEEGAGTGAGTDGVGAAVPVPGNVVTTIETQTGRPGPFAESKVTVIGKDPRIGVVATSTWIRRAPVASTCRLIWLRGMFVFPTVPITAT